ncbi:protein phosphatase 2C domain-containing protein [Streptomyces olivaceus]
MSQQGGRPTGPVGPEDDWWGQLYDDSTDDTGPTAAPDSLDDRFASAADTVTGPPDAGPPPTVPGPRVGPPPTVPGPPDAGPPVVPGPRVGPPSTVPGPPDAGPPPAGPGPSGAGSPVVPGPRTGEPPPPAFRRPGAAAPGVPWVPRPTDPAEPSTSPPAGPPPQNAPETRNAQETPDAPNTPRPLWSAQPPQPPHPPRGRTASGTGAADLTEPPDPSVPGAPPPPPPRAVSDLPPPPPPFLPSRPAEQTDRPGGEGTPMGYVGSGPPTYDAEPTALPPADPDGLDGLVPDTVLDGSRYGACTLRAVSVRGDSARYRGEPRRDALLVARFGAGEQALVLVAMATGARATPGAHRAAAEVCRWIGRAVGRSHARLAEDLRAGRRGDLKSGLHRLTDRSLGRLRAGAAEQGLAPDEYAATLRCLLLPADPECRTRVFFGVGPGGLLRLRDGAWQDMEPSAGDVTGGPVLGYGGLPAGTPWAGSGHAADGPPEDDRLTMDLGVTAAPGPYDGPPAERPREPFRFRASVARPGDVLLMCTAGLAEPLLSEPGLGELLARRWAGRTPPGLAEFLADSGVRVKGYADDRTAAAVWEA